MKQKILQAMREAGLRQSDLAKKIGVSPQAVSSYLKGEFLPGEGTLLKIAESTNYPVSWFYGDETLGKVSEPAPAHGQQSVISDLKIQEEQIRAKYAINQPISFEMAFSGDHQVKIMAMELPVGAGVISNDDFQYTEIDVPSRVSQGASHLLTVRGHSMEPGIEDGDNIWMYINNPYAWPAEGKLIVANIVGDGIRVSHIFYREDGRVGLGQTWDKATWYQQDELRIVGIVTQIHHTRETVDKMAQAALDSKPVVEK